MLRTEGYWLEERISKRYLVVSGGEIVERGNHSSLMDMDGIYAHMVSLQAV